jgi:membrane-bound metal-dependent hydrolase YbcI (DUF457 family)
MFLIGHLALGYLLGKYSAVKIGEKAILPWLFLLSILPDVDFFVGLPHHGPTHSIIFISLVFLPFFLRYGRKVFPYFVAMAQHLLGDLFEIGGLMLFWPVSSSMVTQPNEFGRAVFTSLGFPYYSDYIRFDIFLELACFSIVMFFLIKGDASELLTSNFHNLVLIVPVAGIICSIFLFENPLVISLAQFVFLLIFCASLLKVLNGLISQVIRIEEV